MLRINNKANTCRKHILCSIFITSCVANPRHIVGTLIERDSVIMTQRESRHNVNTFFPKASKKATFTARAGIWTPTFCRSLWCYPLCYIITKNHWVLTLLKGYTVWRLMKITSLNVMQRKTGAFTFRIKVPQGFFCAVLWKNHFWSPEEPSL